MRFWLGVLLVAYLPGALIFRLPIGDRARRASLAVEERLFWHVILSLAWSLLTVLLLAAAGEYRFERLLMGNALAGAALLVTCRLQLLYRGNAAGPTATLLLPIALVVLAVWRFFPASEYV
ncbi:MAG: hypothetical protein ACM4AI_09245, partial [Acidobacteriota bacterium]